MFQINTPYFVSASPENPLPDSTRDRQISKNENSINAILTENNQSRKIIPEGDLQILKAISYSLFFTTQHQNVIHVACNQHLLKLLRFNNLGEKLQIFKNNMLLIREFTRNPCENPSFERALMELVSQVFKVKIVIYNVTEDLYLTSLIINNRFERTIQLFKSGNHYDVLYDKNKTEAIKNCQELIYEDWLTQSPDVQLADFLLNFQADFDSKMKSKHKKSLSDNFNISHEQMEAEQKKYFDMFSNLKEPEEFFTKLTPSSKSRFAKNFPNNEEELLFGKSVSDTSKNLNCDYFSNNLALKNYNISPSNISSLNASFTKVAFEEPGKSSKIPQKSLFFPDGEISNPEHVPAHSKNSKSPIYYVGTPPPGLTPKKVPHETPKSMKKINDNFLVEGQEQEKMDGNKSNSPPGFFNNRLKAPNFQPLHISIENEISKTHPNVNQIPINHPSETPKKMIIIDESEPKTRKTGRLKFFDENKNYGFIVMDEEGSDLFVHFDDLSKAGVNKDLLRSAKHGSVVRFSFTTMNYIGKYNKSKKAVELELILT